MQVASIFNAFGSRVQLFQAGPRILPTEDEDVSAAVAAAFRESGIGVRESFGTIEFFEKTPIGVRMVFSKDGARDSAEAALAVVAVGWVADTAGLNLPAAGVETDPRGYVRVDAYLRTAAPHIFAAGDITGRLMLAPPGGSGRFRGGDQRRAWRNDDARGAGKSDRQLHRPGICPGGPDRSEGA